MKKIVIALTLTTLVCTTCNARRCKNCDAKGLLARDFTCEYCEGTGCLAPERLGMAAGVTRWTETTYRTGIRTIDNVRHKKYSKKGCPGCARSRTAKPGIYRRDVTCDVCNGLGVVAPFSTYDIEQIKKTCDRIIKDLRKIDEYGNKKIRGRTDDDPTKRAMVELSALIGKRNDEIKEIKSTLPKAMATNDDAIITKDTNVLCKISQAIDNVKLGISQLELSEKYPDLETAEKYRKNH